MTARRISAIAHRCATLETSIFALGSVQGAHLLDWIGGNDHAALGRDPSTASRQQYMPYGQTLRRLGTLTAFTATVVSSTAPARSGAWQCTAGSLLYHAGVRYCSLASSPASLKTDEEQQPDSPSSSSSAAVLDPAPELLAARGQLMDSLAVCLGLQQLDSLLARQADVVFDELVLLTTLDTAYRLCNSVTASSTVPLTATAAAAAHKSASKAASDALTRASELLIQRLSEPGGLSAEGAVRALRTLAMLRFNPAGDYVGLMTMAAFYRDSVVPQLESHLASPDLQARAPQLLIDLFFAFSRLFDVAARRDRAIQAQLQAARLAEETVSTKREDDAAAAAGAGADSPPPWERATVMGGLNADGNDGLAVGDRKLYSKLGQMLAAQGMLSNAPSKALGTLATAMATSHVPHYPLAQSIATQTLLRLQGGGSAAAAAAGIRVEAQPTSGAAMAVSTLSNIISCLAKLGFEHETLCDAIANWMLQRLGASDGGRGSALRGGPGLCGGAVGGIEPHHIVDVAVGFARLKYENPDFMARVSEVLLLKLPQSTANSVAMMAWAVANSKSGRSPDFTPLLDALGQRMVVLHHYGSVAGRGSGAGGSGMTVVPRHLACIVYAMARLGHLQPRLLDTVAQDVLARAGSYQARQLVSTLRAFTLLGSYRPEMYDAACAVLEQRMRTTAHQPAAALAVTPPTPEYIMLPSHYADLAWSIALVGHSPGVPELMEMLAERVAETAGQLGKAGLVRAAQAFAVAQPTAATPRVFDAIAQASRLQLADLGPPYLAALVDAFAEVQHPVTEDFWLGCMEAAGLKMPYMDRPQADMQAAALRLAASFRRHPATSSFPACQTHFVLSMLDEIQGQSVENQL